MINVLIVEDSIVTRQLLHFILSADPEINVIGTAKDGQEGVDMASRLKPDAITMDIHMPNLDGYQATRQIMETSPVPIIIVSASWKPQDVAKTFKAMEAGAITALEKPVGLGHPNHKAMAEELRQTVKLMSEVKVVKRRPKPTPIGTPVIPNLASPATGKVKVAAIGVSTGGPPLLQAILTALPVHFPIPVLIVQHIAPGFLKGLVDWLNQTARLPVHIAADRQIALPGHVYFAPDSFHMGINGHGQIRLSQSEPENNLRPAVSYLFRSVAEAYGQQAIGIILTGMGKDGAAELKHLRDKGAITIAQDKETSVVHGMPGEAIKLGGAKYILSAAEIAPTLMNLVNNRKELSHDPR